MFRIFILATSILLMFGGCNAESSVKTTHNCGESVQKFTVIANETELSFRGLITPCSSQLLINEMDSKKFDTLNITSQGGDIESAIDIGYKINELNMKLNVVKYCISACASYLLTASPNASIEQDSIVLFHTTATSLLNIIDSSSFPAFSTFYSKAALKEQLFYRDMGISQNMLVAAASSLIPICMVTRNGSNPQSASDIGISWMYASYYINHATLIKFGVKEIIGYPMTLEEVSRSSKRYFPKMSVTTLNEMRRGMTIGMCE